VDIQRRAPNAHRCSLPAHGTLATSLQQLGAAYAWRMFIVMVTFVGSAELPV
jgi:hypothetical protein